MARRPVAGWLLLGLAGCAAPVMETKPRRDCLHGGPRCPAGQVCTVEYDGDPKDHGVPRCEPAPGPVDTSRFPCHSASAGDGGWIDLSDGGCR